MDSGLMRDPTTANSRIYLGNLADAVTREDIEQKFQQYGIINGVLLNRGFGFIQFNSEESAQSSISNEGGKLFHGRKMIVRNAVNNASATNNQNKNNSSAQNSGILTPGDGGQGNTWWNNRGFANNNYYNERERSPIDGPDDNRWNFNNRVNNAPPGNANYNMRLPVPNYAKDVYGRSPDQNDCEIIVVSKDLTEYAENIESRLKRVGLSVDLLFPNDDVPMGKVLANISSRGTLYAILVTHQNQELRSITVNVLHGIPAEHRNMPVDDAIAFIGTNFQENRQKALPKSVPIIQPQGNAPPLNERHPDAVQALLNLLAENRPLTVLQYERIIKYLQDRKVLQIKAELGDAATDIHLPSPEELAEAAKAEAKIAAEKELQDKIMHILNKPSIIPTIVPEDEPIRPVQVAASSSSSNSDLLHDPKVQKALDSLLGGFF